MKKKEKKLEPESPIRFFDYNPLNSINLTIEGEPIGKGRPRVTSRNGFAHAYSPKKTKNYEFKIKQDFIRKYGYLNQLQGPLEVEMTGYFPIPQSASKKKKNEMLDNTIMHIHKPDIDNMIKSVLDGLNELAYNDDSQIVKLSAEKLYSDDPRVEVSIKKINPKENKQNNYE